MPGDKRYWFPAKRHGWGWGFPSSWQGWVVLGLYVVLVVLGAFALLPLLKHPAVYFSVYLGYVAILTGLFLAICWWKGEPPRWRWGGDDD